MYGYGRRLYGGSPDAFRILLGHQVQDLALHQAQLVACRTLCQTLGTKQIFPGCRDQTQIIAAIPQ